MGVKYSSCIGHRVDLVNAAVFANDKENIQ